MEVGAFRKTKRPGYRGNFGGYVLDRDQFGLWAFTPGGSVGHWLEHGEESLFTLPEELAHLRLIPPSGWWIASWWPDGNVYVDAVTPVQFLNGAWSWVDLELDIRRLPDGIVLIEDEDEFDVAVAAGHISVDEQREARAVAQQLAQWLTDRTPPFDDTGRRRFDEAVAKGLQPLEPPPTP